MKKIIVILLVLSLNHTAYGFINALHNTLRMIVSSGAERADQARMKRSAAETLPYLSDFDLSNSEMQALRYTCLRIAQMIQDPEQRMQVVQCSDAFELYSKTALQSELDALELENESLGRVLDALDVVHAFAPSIPYVFSKNQKAMLRKATPLIERIQKSNKLFELVKAQEDIPKEQKEQLAYALFIDQMIALQKIQLIESYGAIYADWNRWSALSTTYFSSFDDTASLKTVMPQGEYVRQNREQDSFLEKARYVRRTENNARLVLSSVDHQVRKELGEIQELKEVVGEEVDKNKLKKQYREWARENHPDKGGDVETFTDLNELYQSYKNNPCRNDLDEWSNSGQEYLGSCDNYLRSYSPDYALFRADRYYSDKFLKDAKQLDRIVFRWLCSHPLKNSKEELKNEFEEMPSRGSLFNNRDD